MTAVALPMYDLPWSISSLDSQRFRRILSVCLALMILFGVIVPWLEVPEAKQPLAMEPPAQLTRIVMEKPVVVIPPPPPAPDQVVNNEPTPLPKNQPVEKVRQAIAEKPIPQPTVADAREKAAVSGLLAFKDAFADMRDAVDVSKLNDTGAIARGTGDAATIDRALLTSKHGTRSAGVNLAGLSRNTGGVALSGRATTKVDAPPGAVGQGGAHAIAGGKSADDPRERSIEEIRRVFDSNKGAIFAIYNRALREDSSLQGKVVLELKIDPTGHVLECRVVSSEIADETLVGKIVSRIRMFDFGRKDVGTTTISYPVQFLPT